MAWEPVLRWLVREVVRRLGGTVGSYGDSEPVSRELASLVGSYGAALERLTAGEGFAARDVLRREAEERPAEVGWRSQCDHSMGASLRSGRPRPRRRRRRRRCWRRRRGSGSLARGSRVRAGATGAQAGAGRR